MTGATSTSGAGEAAAEATLRSQPAPSTVTNTSTIRKPSKFQFLRFRRRFRCLRICLVYIPLAVNFAPSLASKRKSRSPHLSMNVTSLRSTMQSRRTSVRWLFFQHALSSCTQGSVSRPCRAHLSSSGVSLKVIFNILFSSRRVDSWGLCDRKDDCVDMLVISSSAPHRCSCCTFPGARVPRAASRPGRSHEFRHARCESQMLAHGFVPTMARFCGFPLGRLTEECFSRCSRHSYQDFAISYFLLSKISKFL